ncbi:MAG: group II truncated hemoglobin [Burkholderiaceae bacterium]|jgi:hemoglobin
MQIGEAAASPPFDAIGGELKLRELVDRFYDLMDLDPAFAGLRALHPPSLAGSRDKLFWFLCGLLGGPNHYVNRFGHPMLRARHLPFAIGTGERDQWLACMRAAMDGVGLEPGLCAQLFNQFSATADWMRNRPS